MADAYSNLLIERHADGYAVVTLNRPEALNALNAALFKDLADFLDSVEQDDSVRCLVLTGSAKAFTAGTVPGAVTGGATDSAARFYAFDLTFAETVRRHATRPKAGDFSAEEMAAWYHGWQPLDFVAEHRITAAEPPEEVVERILLHA